MIIIIITDFFVKVSTFFSLLWVSTLVDVDSYAQLLLVNTSTVISMAVMTMGLVNSSFRLLAAHKGEEIINDKFVTIAYFCFFSITIFFVFIKYILGFFELGHYNIFLRYLWLWYSVILVESLYSLSKNLCYIRGKQGYVACASLLGVLTFFLFLSFFYCIDVFTVELYFSAIIFSGVIRLWVLLLGLNIHERLNFNELFKLKEIRFSLLFLLHVIGLWGMQYLPAWIIYPVIDNSELSIIIWSNLILSALIMIPDAMFKSSPRLISNLFNPDKNTSFFAIKLFFQGVTFMSVLLIFSVLFINTFFILGYIKVNFNLIFWGYMQAFIFLHMLYFVLQKIVVGYKRLGYLVISTLGAVFFQVVFLSTVNEYTVLLILMTILIAKVIQIIILSIGFRYKWGCSDERAVIE